MKQDDILVKNGVLYIYDDYEEAVFKFTGMGKGNYCEIKFRGEKPYKAECTTDIATQAYSRRGDYHERGIRTILKHRNGQG